MVFILAFGAEFFTVDPVSECADIDSQAPRCFGSVSIIVGESFGDCVCKDVGERWEFLSHFLSSTRQLVPREDLKY